jgi:hypothetical protein
MTDRPRSVSEIIRLSKAEKTRAQREAEKAERERVRLQRIRDAWDAVRYFNLV